VTLDFTGKTALVTGAASGIGKAGNSGSLSEFCFSTGLDKLLCACAA
jgi:hypothetical protein